MQKNLPDDALYDFFNFYKNLKMFFDEFSFGGNPICTFSGETQMSHNNFLMVMLYSPVWHQAGAGAGIKPYGEKCVPTNCL